MVDYTLRIDKSPADTINTMLRWQSERNDAKAKQRKDDYMKLMQMLGRGVGALKANNDYNAWKADQAYWNDEADMLDLIGTGYYDPNDIDIDAVLANEAALSNRTGNDWRDQYANSHRYGVDDLPTLKDLGLA